MFKWMSAFALAMLVYAPALAEEEEEYRRPGYYQYYYQYRYYLPPEQHVIEVVQPPYSGNFIINGARFTAGSPASANPVTCSTSPAATANRRSGRII